MRKDKKRSVLADFFFNYFVELYDLKSALITANSQIFFNSCGYKIYNFVGCKYLRMNQFSCEITMEILIHCNYIFKPKCILLRNLRLNLPEWRNFSLLNIIFYFCFNKYFLINIFFLNKGVFFLLLLYPILIFSKKLLSESTKVSDIFSHELSGVFFTF